MIAIRQHFYTFGISKDKQLNMFRRKLLFLLVLTGSFNMFAQSFSSPESVEWDAANTRWLIANPGSGKIQAQIPGNNPVLFASGCTSGPHGIEILGNVIYANDGGRVRGFDLSNGTEVFNLNLQASFLNGLTTDGDSVLYATDFSAGKVYRINPTTNSYYAVQTNMSETPNGILYDAANERCIIVCWGGSAPILAMSVLPPYNLTTVMNTSLGNCDGVSRDQNGYYYVAAWGNNRLNRISPDFSGTPQTLSQALFSPADIDIKWDVIDTAGIPNSSNNTVTYLPLSSTAETVELQQTEASLHVFPDGTGEMLIVDVLLPNDQRGVVEVFNSEGKKCATHNFESAYSGKQLIQLPRNASMKGLCVVRVQTKNGMLEQKIVL